MADTSGIMPSVALSGGALLTGGISYIALSNQVDKLNENIKKSDIQLIKMVRLISDHNDTILNVSHIEDIVQNNSKLLSEMIDTNQELLKRIRDNEYSAQENERYLKHIETFLLLDDKYQPFYNLNSYNNQGNDYQTSQSNYYSDNTNRYYDESNYNNNGNYPKQNDREESSMSTYDDRSNYSNYNQQNNGRNNNNDDGDMDEDELLKQMRSRR